MTRLAVCVVVALAVLYAAESLLEGKDIPLWNRYGPWIRDNKVQAVAVLAAVLYGASLALWPEEKKGPDGYEACT
ncbi:MAG: hypothetical protein J6J87_07600 [Oscillospiraceae bacterium]|nr:hypothetical protein [Oscillospiraceae bacterium]